MDEQIVQRTVKALGRNGFLVHVADDPAQAREIILADILPGVAPGLVSYGDSMTLQATGVLDDMRVMAGAGGWEFLDTFGRGISRGEILERRRQALLSELFFTGTNALTEQGQLVNLDMIGNRVGGIVWGPRNVVLTIGTNKIVDGVDAAVTRVRDKAAPLNAARHGAHTPCAKTGKCMDCDSPHRICNVWTITEKSWPKGRIRVVLIRGDYGL